MYNALVPNGVAIIAGYVDIHSFRFHWMKLSWIGFYLTKIAEMVGVSGSTFYCFLEREGISSTSKYCDISLTVQWLQSNRNTQMMVRG